MPVVARLGSRAKVNNLLIVEYCLVDWKIELKNDQNEVSQPSVESKLYNGSSRYLDIKYTGR